MMNTERSSQERLDVRMPPPGAGDAQGFACARCGRALPAHLATELCLTCKLVVAPPAPQLSPSDLRVKRRVWPWLVIVAVAGGALAVAVTLWNRAQAQHALEDGFPIRAIGGDRTVLSREVKAWDKGRKKLVASLAAFDSSTVRVGGAACPLFQNAMSASEVDARNGDEGLAKTTWGIDPDRGLRQRLQNGPKLASLAKERLDALVGAAKRGRFRSEAGREQVVGMVQQDALIVLELNEDLLPDVDMVRRTFQTGYRSGNAYAFDRETGELRCAGSFEAKSSDKVSVLSGELGLGGNEHAAIRRDFEAQTDRAIASSLRLVGKAGEPGMFAVGVPNGAPLSVADIANEQAHCDNSEAEACTNLAWAMRRGEAPDDPAKRIALFTRGCELGDKAACNALALAYLHGHGVARDVRRGVDMIEKACTSGAFETCALLGAVYSNGIYTEPDTTKASDFFRRACDHGYSGSCSELERLQRPLIDIPSLSAPGPAKAQ